MKEPSTLRKKRKKRKQNKTKATGRARCICSRFLYPHFVMQSVSRCRLPPHPRLPLPFPSLLPSSSARPSPTQGGNRWVTEARRVGGRGGVFPGGNLANKNSQSAKHGDVCPIQQQRITTSKKKTKKNHARARTHARKKRLVCAHATKEAKKQKKKQKKTTTTTKISVVSNQAGLNLKYKHVDCGPLHSTRCPPHGQRP